MEKAVAQAIPVTPPASSATTGGLRHSTATALSAAMPTRLHGSQLGPKALRCSRTAEGTMASSIIADSAQRPSHSDLRRHAQIAPMLTSAAIGGARATV